MGRGTNSRYAVEEVMRNSATLEPATMSPKAQQTPEKEARSEPDKRRQILDGASQVFLDQGFDAASMGTIARTAGVSKGTLYVYFKSKEELFEAIIEEQRRQQAERIFTLNADADIETELRRLGQEFVSFLCRPEGISSLRTVIAIAERMPELGAKYYQTGPMHAITSLKAYLDEKVAAGVLVPHDTEVTAAQFIDSCASLNFKPMMFNYSGTPSKEQVARVVDGAVKTFLAAYLKD